MLTKNQLADMGISPELYSTLSDIEKKVVDETLAEMVKGKGTKVLDELYYADYSEVPVSFIDFITDDYYIGKSTKHGASIYDFWKKEGTKIFNHDDIVEIALSGAIGIGKSTAACVMMAYQLYRLMCMRNPQEFFGLADGSTIAVVFFNNTLASSKDVGYRTLQNFLMDSPWFLKRGKIVGREDMRYVPDGGFEILVGSRVQHTIGRDVAIAMIDEASFAPGQDANYQNSKIMNLYRNIRRRINSRFTIQGKNYGKLFLVSSKSTESSFLEAYTADQIKKGYPIYVVDQPLWVVKPQAYSGATFKVAVGNKYVPSRIVPEGSVEFVEDYCKGLVAQGMTIIDVPIEEKQAFDQDIDKALQDIAGIATAVTTKAFSSHKVLEATSDTLENPFTNEIISLGMNDTLQLKDFFDVSKIPEQIYGLPVFIHLDASITGDRTGLAGVAIVGTRQSVRQSYDEIDEMEKEEIIDELMCQEVFHVGIQPPSDSEISFEKTRQFIYYLKDYVGLNIKMVSTDGFQSVDFRQILSTKGFEVKYTSLDRTPDGYDGLRSAIYDKRMLLLKNGNKLFEELTELERDNMSRKYDHTAYSTKDIADGLAGAHADAMQFKDEFMFFHPEDYDYEGLNDRNNEEDLFKNELIQSVTATAKKPVFEKKDVAKNLTAEDIFATIDTSNVYDDDILFL